MKKCITFFFSIFTVACAPVRPLQNHDFYFAGYKFEKNHSASNEQLDVLLTQKPNSFVGKSRLAPYLVAYFLGKKRFPKDSLRIIKKIEDIERKTTKKIVKLNQKFNSDTLKYDIKLRNLRAIRSEKVEFYQNQLENGNWLMTSIGEKPVFFDSLKAAQTVAQIQRYYANMGYYQTRVEVVLDTLKKRRIVATFRVEENNVFKIKEFKYQVADTLLRQIILSDSSNRISKVGGKFSYNDLQNERERVAAMLMERGFFTFKNQAIYFQVDTSHTDYSAKVLMVVSPGKLQNFRPYTIAQTSFYSDRGVSRLDSAIGKIFFYQDEVRYHIKTLYNKIFIYPGNVFSEQHVNQTQRALRDTDMFKFVNVQFDTAGNVLYANIFTSPFKKFEYSSETGLNVTQALPGPFVRFSIKDRNVFGRLDILELTLRGGLESQASATQVQAQSQISGAYLSTELGGNLNLSFPRIMFPLGLQVKEKLNRRTTRTSFNLSLAFIERPEYSRQNTLSGFRYRWKSEKNQIFTITPFEGGVVNTSRVADNFNNRLLELFNQGNPLIFSFSRSLISSSIFEFVNPYEQIGTASRGKYLRAEFETGGTYQNLIAQRIESQNEFLWGLRVFRFLRGAIEVRYAKPVSAKSQFVGRFMGGAIFAYSPSKALPYEKFFFSGGSNSNRAWPPRRVGPGSFRPAVNRNGFFEYNFEQPGEIIIETNIEYRRKIYSFINLAAFIDASNVWLFREDPTRPNAEFRIDRFHKEMAIGTGLGIRLDFSFLLVRFDLGIKAYDPARPETNRFIINKILSNPPLGEKGQSVFNMGIGYPF